MAKRFKRMHSLSMQEPTKVQDPLAKRMSIRSYLDSRDDLPVLFHKAYGKLYSGKLLTKDDWNKIIK